MIGLAILMAVLPSAYPASGVRIVALLLLGVGLVDIVTAIFFAPTWARLLAFWAGVAAVGAAVILLITKRPEFLFASAIVTAWLVVKAVTLVTAAFKSPSFAGREWLLFCAIANLLLAFLSVIVTASLALGMLIFGPVPALGKYSIIPALSMLATGISSLAASKRSSDHR